MADHNSDNNQIDNSMISEAKNEQNSTIPSTTGSKTANYDVSLSLHPKPPPPDHDDDDDDTRLEKMKSMNDPDDIIIKEMEHLLSMRQEEEIEFNHHKDDDNVTHDGGNDDHMILVHDDDDNDYRHDDDVANVIEELLNGNTDHDNELGPLVLEPPIEAAAVVGDDNNNNVAVIMDENLEQQPVENDLLRQINAARLLRNQNKKSNYTYSYRIMSIVLMFSFIYYAFRTRKQYYPAMVFLSNSKWSYVIFGNALIALTLSIFDSVVYIFLNGLRMQEVDGLNDFFRWNVTETCLALTMFRNQFHNVIGIYFVLLIAMKCLHHVASLREQHLRSTQETIYIETNNIFIIQNNNNDDQDINDTDRNNHNSNRGGQNNYFPVFRRSHVKVLSFLLFLQFIDLMILEYTISSIITYGPTVHILFAFEAAIMLVSSWSHIVLWLLHCIDSILIFGHEKRSEQMFQNEDPYHTGNRKPIVAQFLYSTCHKLLHPWKEYKATLQFAIQLQAQAIQFIFYTTFFIIILTSYGLPINLFREVYISYISLKERLIAFLKYRQLMSSMNRFDNIDNDNELDEIGRTCIICRDDMTLYDCKRLPVCKHIFHKSCLREWLVQQQTCPTCRSDISANELLEQQRRNAANAADQRNINDNNNQNNNPNNDNNNADNNNQNANNNAIQPVTTNSNNNVDENNPNERDRERKRNIGITDSTQQQETPAKNNTKNEGLGRARNNLDPLLFDDPQRSEQRFNDPLRPLENTMATTSGVTRTPTTSSVNEEEMKLRNEINDCILQTTILFEQLQSYRSAAAKTTTKEGVSKLSVLDEQKQVAEVVATTEDRSGNTAITNKSQRINYSFPSIYQVTESDGALVILDCFNQSTQPTTIRTIPHQTLVFAQGRAVTSTLLRDDNNNRAKEHDITLGDNNASDGCFIKVPDGWIAEKSLCCIAIIERG